jgi:hypothetical protein
MPYMGGRRDRATLIFNPDVYTPEGAKTISDRELRKEYSRLRSIARKRLERFEGTEWTDTQVYKQNVGVYKPLKEMQSNREMRYLFSQLARFITADTSSVRGLEKQRETAVKTLNDRGYTFVNKGNFRKFADFMEYTRVMKLNRLYDSKRIAEFYSTTEVKGKSNQQLFDDFQAYEKKQRKRHKVMNRNPRNSKLVRRDLDD